MKPSPHKRRPASLFARHGIKLCVAACVVAGVVFFMVPGKKSSGPERPPAPRVVNIIVPPPPPPPPPPKPRELKPEPAREDQQMIMQETIAEAEQAPSNAPAPSDAPLGTGVVGNGPADGFGLGTGPGGGGLFGGGGARSSGSGSRWGWYAGQVQSGIQSALSAHPRTRALSLDTRVRLWLDATGRVERVELSGPGIPPDVVVAVREALVGLQMRQTTPGDMPMPIVLRISARRPA